MQKSDIIKYYESCDGAYKKAWDLDNSLAFHYGFWDKHITSLPQALAYENEVLANIAGISQTDHVLDAGCGIGGSCIYLAQKQGCKVTGISLSTKQVKEAEQHAKNNHVDHLVDFKAADFCHTDFRNESYDVVWAIESVCYAAIKADFLKEAYRLLKPEGRLIIADGFGLKNNYTAREQYLMDRMNHGWQVQELENIHRFTQSARTAGFRNIRYQSENRRIWPSARRLFWFSLLAIPYGKFEVWTGKMSRFQLGNAYTAHYQYRTLQKRLWEYGIFYAEK